MKKIVFAVLCAGFMSSAFAKDSTWLMCIGDAVLYGDNVQLAVNVFEHRAEESKRSTDLTLIYGGQVLQGKFDSTESDSGLTILKNADSTFRGSASMNYADQLLALSGRLTLFGSATMFKTSLKCTTLIN